ncbi:MAG: hypothetical protein LC720_08160, partial [Actinobacteria bacterium]|nr:hypothetical protein [Actinomycetota bacterium]
MTSGFDDAVRRAVIDRTPGPGYTQERDFGFAVAKTISQDDGSIDVIVDAGIFSLTARPGDAARTFEHEGLHIAIDERGESVAGLRRRRGSSPTAAAAIFASMAGVSSEEYRVERVLWQESPDVRADSHLAHFGTIARRTQETICAASFRYERDLDVPVIGRTVSDAFLALATSTAYVAAEIDATGGARDVKVDAGIYARLLGPRWRDVIEELRCLPPGDVASVGTALDVQNDRLPHASRTGSSTSASPGETRARAPSASASSTPPNGLPPERTRSPARRSGSVGDGPYGRCARRRPEPDWPYVSTTHRKDPHDPLRPPHLRLARPLPPAPRCHRPGHPDPGRRRRAPGLRGPRHEHPEA